MLVVNDGEGAKIVRMRSDGGIGIFVFAFGTFWARSPKLQHVSPNAVSSRMTSSTLLSGIVLLFYNIDYSLIKLELLETTGTSGHCR